MIFDFGLQSAFSTAGGAETTDAALTAGFRSLMVVFEGSTSEGIGEESVEGTGAGEWGGNLGEDVAFSARIASSCLHFSSSFTCFSSKEVT